MLPYIFSQKPDERGFLYDDLLDLRDEDILNTDAFKKLDDLTREFNHNKDTTCRNWLYLRSLANCYVAQQGLPEEFTFDEIHPKVEVLLSNSADESKIGEYLTLCRRDMKPRQLDIEKQVEEKLNKRYGKEEEQQHKDEL